MTRPLRIAALALHPDLGHVIPLLRVARATRVHGVEVRSFVSEGARRYVERHGLDAEYVGAEGASAADELFGRLLAARGSLSWPVAVDRLYRERAVPIRSSATSSVTAVEVGALSAVSATP